MKLFWKIYFTAMIISIISFSIGSATLLYFGFQDSLEREIESSFLQNDILNYSLTEELRNMSDTNINPFGVEQRKGNITKEKILKQIASSVSINEEREELHFRINNNKGELIYSSFDYGDTSYVDSSNIISQLSSGKKGYEIVVLNNKKYIHTVTPLMDLKSEYYIENFRDVSEIFQNRDEQINTYLYIIIFMLIFSSFIIFIISWILVRPIRTLSKATKQIAKGNYGERVSINSNDEIGELTEDFNLMASNLEANISELKDVNVRQEEFIASFAHETKTPLTSMIGYADMLRSKKMTGEQIIMSANYIFEEGKRIEALSGKLLELIVLKKQSFEMKRVSTQEFFNEIQGIMFPVFEEKNIEFEVYAEDCLLKMEPDLMKTVCINLLDNAKKALEPFGKVKFIGKKIEDSYFFFVRDNGKGMEEKELERIKEPFYMVDKSRARIQGGSGLGLAICSEIIEIHGASMIIESEVNKGTCITIEMKGVENKW